MDEQRSNPEESFGLLMERLLTNWPVDAKRERGKRQEMFKVFQEVGGKRFKLGVDGIIAVNPYKAFPTQAEFRGFIPTAPRKPLCGNCDTGWKVVPDYAARSLYGNKQAMCTVRCECRRGPGYEKWERRAEWRAGQ